MGCFPGKNRDQGLEVGTKKNDNYYRLWPKYSGVRGRRGGYYYDRVGCRASANRGLRTGWGQDFQSWNRFWQSNVNGLLTSRSDNTLIFKHIITLCMYHTRGRPKGKRIWKGKHGEWNERETAPETVIAYTYGHERWITPAVPFLSLSIYRLSINKPLLPLHLPQPL